MYIAAIGISSVIAKGLNRHFVKKKKKVCEDILQTDDHTYLFPTKTRRNPQRRITRSHLAIDVVRRVLDIPSYL